MKSQFQIYGKTLKSGQKTPESNVQREFQGKDSSRREFLVTVAGTAAGLAAAAGMELVTSPAALAQSTLSPDAALQELLEGNKRFTAGRLT
jgi:hypothetical protein